MKKKPLLVLPLTLMVLGLTACQSVSAPNISDTSTESSEAIAVDTTVSEISEETSVTETSAEITEIVTSETDFVTSLPNMRYVEFDGTTLQDGIYLIDNCTYDENRLGVTCNIYGFPYLLEDDIKLLKEGDTIRYENTEYTVGSIYPDNINHPVSLSIDCYSLERQFNGQYFIEDGCDYRILGNAIAELYHVKVSPNVIIWQGYIFGIGKEEHDSWYLDNEYSDQLRTWGIDNANGLVHFENIDELINAWDQECEYQKFYCDRDNMEYVERLYGYYPGGLVVVEDQTITELYINPWQHQPLFLYTDWWNSEKES